MFARKVFTNCKQIKSVLNVAKRNAGGHGHGEYDITVVGLRGQEALFVDRHAQSKVDTDHLTLPLYDPKVENKASENVADLEYAANTSAKKTKLANGFTVVSTDSYYKGNAVVSLFVDAGSRYESFKNNGISHFVERFLYAPTNQRSFLRVTHELQKTGANVSAEAGREEIVYRTESVRDAVPRLWSVIANSVLQSRLLDWDMPPKRDAVKNDLAVLAESPEILLNEALHFAAFGGKGLGRALVCPPHNVNSIKAEQIVEYMNSHYRPDRMTLVATNIAHEDAVAISTELFGDMVVESGTPVTKEASVYYGGDHQIGDRRDNNDGHVAVAFQGVRNGDKSFYAYQVLAALLGDSTSVDIYTGSTYGRASLLSEVTELPTIQQAKAFNTSYSDAGLFGVYLRGTDKLGEATKKSLSVLQQVASKVDTKAVEAAKRRTLLAFARSIESNVGLNEFVAKSTSTVAEAVNAIKSVTADQVRAAAQEVLKSKPTVASYGNLQSVPTTHDLKL